MSTLSTIILELGFTSERDMEEALARQVMYGGDLGTNLLELELLTEAQLLIAAARAAGLDPAAPGALPAPPPDGQAALTLTDQRRYGVYVLGEKGGALEIAVTEKLSPHLADELAAAAGSPITERVATWARIEQALSRDGGKALPERALSLLKRLEGHASVKPLGPGLPIDFKQLPRPQSVPPIELIGAMDFEGATAPPPDGYQELAQTQTIPPRVDPSPDGYVRAPVTVASRRRGPYTAAMAERDLLEAADRHEVVSAFFDFATQYFEYTALFVIKGGEAVGYRARGAGATSDRVHSVRIPLDLKSAFAKARDEASWLLTRLHAGGIEGGLTRDLGRRPGRKVLVMPLSVKGRTVLLLYGDHGLSDVDLSSIGDVLSFAPLASAALERSILRKKGYKRPPPLLPRRPRPSHGLPSRDQKAEALAGVFGHPSIPPVAPLPEVAEATPTEHTSLPAPGPHSWNTRPQISPTPQTLPGAGRGYGSPFTSEPPHTLPGVASPPNETSEETSVIPPRPTVSLEPGPPDPEEQFNAPEVPAWALSWAEPPEDGWDIDAAFVERESGTAAGVGPSPTGRTLPSFPPTELEVPFDYAALVEQLCSGNDSVLNLLQNGGDLAIAALAARFPGPLLEAPRGKASECGPLLNAIVSFGARAIPYLTVRTADDDARVREWATRLLGELPSRESAQAVARRTVDESIEVRRGALASARALRSDPESRRSVQRQLEELALDQALGASERRAAIEALTDLREERAFPCLMQLLGDESQEISGTARWSLVVLSRQDFGPDPVAWADFWSTNQARHRVEWLIDALTHDNRDVRRAAGDELKKLSKEYFGYYDDLPEQERVRVQQLYQKWWTQDGRARFI